MKNDPEILAHAKAFVNGLKAGKNAHVPALRFAQWQQFMTAVRCQKELAA
ncbi:succinate dehydrogenase flavoprotein subunit [Erwinia typographi]|uniref:Succinate dehydrogenase flavoprotein subunit n=1 Tax=Erwinia typographi TaxID=371042 RepID=A0A0A3Z7C6_9GAMM|nr:hypothetical protein [Erwinia typographi]KGT94770.1 succinate dehydrogenase flavoprotein subunit [Erwinia typographi]